MSEIEYKIGDCVKFKSGALDSNHSKSYYSSYDSWLNIEYMIITKYHNSMKDRISIDAYNINNEKIANISGQYPLIADIELMERFDINKVEEALDKIIERL